MRPPVAVMIFMDDESVMGAVVIPVAVLVVGPGIVMIVGQGCSGGGPAQDCGGGQQEKSMGKAIM